MGNAWWYLMSWLFVGKERGGWIQVCPVTFPHLSYNNHVVQ